MVDKNPVRQYVRVPSDVAITVSSVSGVDNKSLGLGKDIGGGGCMFLCSECFQTGQLIQIEFGVGFEVVKTFGRVAHTTPSDNALHQVGVEFLMLHPEDAETLGKFCNMRTETAQPRCGATQTAIAEISKISDKT